MHLDSRSPEFQEVLSAVVEALLSATKDDRLPSATSEEIHGWLTQLSIEDVSNVYQSILLSKASLVVAANRNSPPPIAGRNHQASHICAGCGTSLPGTAKFCPECGRTVAGSLRCTNCSAHLSEGANFCSSCGFRVT